MRYPTCLTLGLVLSALSVVGCSSGAAGTSSGSEATEKDNTDVAADCASRCAAKVTGCGASASQAQGVCSNICGLGPTESQMTCLEGATCSSDPDTAAKACGIGATSSSSGKTGSSGAPSKTVCLDASGQPAPGYERYVCQCNKGTEVRSCATDSAAACKRGCGGASTCKCTVE